MPYIYETHVHTAEVSTCGRVPAAQVVREYIAAGFNGLVMTDHFSRYTFEQVPDSTWDEKIDFFLRGFEIAHETAAKEAPDFCVLPGLELRLDCDQDNDFLLYGADEDFLRRSEGLLQMDFAQMAQYVRDSGLVLIQAHPFRKHMTVVDWTLLDGVETYNGNPHHESNNPVADLWAGRHHLLKTSGSDYHGERGEHLGGICTDTPIRSSAQLAQILKNGQYTLFYQEAYSQ